MTAPVAQLDRVPDYESDGRGSESLLAHQLNQGLRGPLSKSFFCSPVALRSALEIPSPNRVFSTLEFSPPPSLLDREGFDPAFHISSVFYFDVAKSEPRMVCVINPKHKKVTCVRRVGCSDFTRE